ncbi:MAG: clostripain-related cysteine peptidase [Caldilineaceae bacterium]
MVERRSHHLSHKLTLWTLANFWTTGEKLLINQSPINRLPVTSVINKKRQTPATPISQRLLCLGGSGLVSVLIVLALLFLLKLNAVATTAQAPLRVHDALAQGPGVSEQCATEAVVPAVECLSLAALFTKTQGAQWLNNTNWLSFASGKAPCDWYGVSCRNGHVTELVLARNHLSGTLPLTLGGLTELTRLRLEENVLTGRVPATICRLTPKLTDASLAYNGLFTSRRSVEKCLQPVAGDWQATQTIPVADLGVSQFGAQRLELTWTPIVYRDDGGYYEIAVATQYLGPYIVHGHTTDKKATSYVVDGLEAGQSYFFEVRTYTPAHGGQPSAVWSDAVKTAGVTKATSGRVLVAAYFPADNDLSDEIPYVVERFQRGTALNPNVQVVLLVDGRKDGDTTLLTIADGIVSTTDVIETQWGMKELDTADPKVLTWFLQYARAHYPATSTVVTLMGHGIALSPEIDWPDVATAAAVDHTQNDEIPPLPQDHEYTPSDVTNRGFMSTVDVGHALLAATNNGARPFDLLFFDQCFQGNLDSLYEVRTTAQVFVASPNYAWLAAAYDKYLLSFTPTATPEEMATAIINRYEWSLDRTNPNAIFWVRSSDIGEIGAAVSDLADALLAATKAGEVDKIIEAVRQSQYVDTTQCGRQNLQLGPPDELIGIESFAKNLSDTFAAGDPYGIHSALEQLHIPMQRVEKTAITGHPYLAPNEMWSYDDSLTLLAPLPRNSPSSVAWRASVYRDDTPFTATWTVDPSQPVTVTQSLAYVRDGHWDEFLGAWFTSLAPTVGQWCNYRPPRQVIVEEADVLSMTAQVDDKGAVTIAWTPTDDKSAVEYKIATVGPYDINWRAGESVALDQSKTTLTALTPGDHRFRIFARDTEGDFVAASNEVTVEVPPNALPGGWQIFLPLINQ